MTTEMIEDAARIVMLSCVLFLLWSFGKKRLAFEQPGWSFLVAGLGLVTFGGIWDLSRNFPEFDAYLQLGSFDLRIILENGLGYLGGLLLIGLGLFQFLPRVDLVFRDNQRHKDDEVKLRKSLDRLGSEVAAQSTELGEARENLEASEARLRAFIQHVPAFIDFEDRNAESMPFILSHDATTGESQPPSLRNAFSSTEPDLTETDRQVLRTGNPVEMEIKAKSNGAERILHAFRFPITDRHQNTLGVGGIAFDVTSQRAQEKKLLRAESIAKIGHWEVTIPENELTWSPETFRIHGLSPDSAQPSVEEALAFYHPDDVERVSENFAQVFETGQLRGVNARLVLQDGRVRHVYADGVAYLQDTSGQPTRIFGTLHDKTEFVEQQEQLRQSQRFEAIGQLAGGIAHDFNNLLAVICGNLELLDEDRTFAQMSERDRRECIASALAAARSGADLTKNMLAFASKSRLEPQRVCVHDLVRETERWLVRTIPSSIALTTNLGATACFCRLDPAGLQSALVNIVVNARDAMPEGGELSIETRNIRRKDTWTRGANESAQSTDEFLELTVKDTGHGIANDLLQTVFEPFVTTKTPSTGTGLGLSMVQGFTRQSGGDVEITSEPDAGTCVRLLLPVDIATEENTEPGKNDSTWDRAEHKQTRVLIVEDQPEVLALLIRSLTSAGYSVEAAASGEQGIKAFREEGPFHLLITDVVMPGALNGPKLATACKALNADLPVLFLTGYSDKLLEAPLDVSSNELCLTKPVPRHELLLAVEQLTR